jgi:hypothetical protein
MIKCKYCGKEFEINKKEEQLFMYSKGYHSMELCSQDCLDKVLEAIRIDVIINTPVDPGSGTTHPKEFYSLIRFGVPRYLENEFRKKLRARNEDFINTLIFLMDKYVKGECLPST